MSTSTLPYSHITTIATTLSNGTSDPATGYDDIPLYLSIIYGIIAAMSIIGNGLIIMVILYNRNILANPTNMLIFTLAIVDCLTGIVMFFTPSLVIRIRYYPFPSGYPGGPIFCHLIDSFYIFFSLGNLSVMLVMLISIERWTAIARATKYRQWFALSRVKVFIALVIIIVCILNLDNLLGKVYDPAVFPPCQWRPIFPQRSQNLTLFLVFEILRLFLPVTIIILCYLDIAKRTIFSSKVGGVFIEQSVKYTARRRVTITCFVSSSVLVACWLPNEIYFTLMNFNTISYSFVIHGITKTLIIFNSCANPFIYAATNRSYRRHILQFVFGKRGDHKSHLHRPSSNINTSHNR